MLYYPKNKRLTRDAMDDVLHSGAVVLAMLVSIGILTWAGIMAIIAVHAWEKANNYPLGFMCKSVFTGYVDTCPKRITDRLPSYENPTIKAIPAIRKVY
jgi:hypothetical protein